MRYASSFNFFSTAKARLPSIPTSRPVPRAGPAWQAWRAQLQSYPTPQKPLTTTTLSWARSGRSGCRVQSRTISSRVGAAAHPGSRPSGQLAADQARLIRRSKISGIGLVVCAVCIFAIVQSGLIPEPLEKKTRRTTTTTADTSGEHGKRGLQNATLTDGPPPIVPVTGDKVDVVGKADNQQPHQVSTGTSTIPTFPTIIQLPPLDGNDGRNDANAVSAAADYHLIGLGIRTVSFLSIQVYVVGLYVAASDVAKLQERLVKKINPQASSLVPAERQRLRELLSDPIKGEEIWDEILHPPADAGEDRGGGAGGAIAEDTSTIRTVFRLVPTRNTDYMHLRDGWVRGITSRMRSRAAAGDHSLDDDDDDNNNNNNNNDDSHRVNKTPNKVQSRQDVITPHKDFGASITAFKALWSAAGTQKSLPKGGILLLSRDANGHMTVWTDQLNNKKKGQPQETSAIGSDSPATSTTTTLAPAPAASSSAASTVNRSPASSSSSAEQQQQQQKVSKLGAIDDERISRLIWLGYLAGKNVSSESLRKDVVDGVVQLVERPVGTV